MNHRNEDGLEPQSKMMGSPIGYEQAGYAMTCRSYDEYVRMFDLDESALQGADVLDIAAGASSFTAEACQRGVRSVAADPLYGGTAQELVLRGREEIKVSTAKIERTAGQFDWTFYGNPSMHKDRRELALERFADDFQHRPDRYIAASLPTLPFEDESFDLVLCSHFLFLYGTQLDAEFHRQALKELLRVCRRGGDLKIYPLVNLLFQPYPDLGIVLQEVNRDGVSVQQRMSRLPFIPGSDQYLCISKIKRF
ncbi:class I SAM-dependent methyltransferase [Paenibacillus gansuensis]|uniref:Class I SAM-dependent methyltransferase n=1 Tax=Paenibacillus gansuensis TaxID=306542 RepID=A0ABW5PE99_9BACL